MILDNFLLSILVKAENLTNFVIYYKIIILYPIRLTYQSDLLKGLKKVSINFMLSILIQVIENSKSHEKRYISVN